MSGPIMACGPTAPRCAAEQVGWILEDNKGMLSIAELPGAKVNHRYRIFEKPL